MPIWRLGSLMLPCAPRSSSARPIVVQVRLGGQSWLVRGSVVRNDSVGASWSTQYQVDDNYRNIRCPISGE